MNLTDCFVRAAWWMLVMGFVAAAGIGSVYCAYHGVTELLAGRWSPGTGAIVVGALLGTATMLACRHRTNLLYG
jgi:hypothetical protein